MYLAIDVGGTKTLLAVFSADGKQKEILKFSTPKTYEDFRLTAKHNISKLKTKKFKLGCAGIPGKLDRDRGVALAFGNLAWSNVPIRKDLQAAVNCELIIENDSKLAGLHEASLLIGEFKKVLYVTVSTGINGALVVNGKLDKNTLDSEMGQMLLEHGGKLVDWEDFGSGRAFVDKFGQKVSEVSDDNHAAWYWLSRNIAIGLIDLIAAYTPEIIVLGGGVGSHLDKFKPRLEEELKIYENPMLSIPEIRQAQDPEKAVIYGCRELMKQQEKHYNAKTH